MMSEMSLPAGTSKQVLAPAIDTEFAHDVQPPASKRHASPRHASGGFRGPQGGGEVPGADHGRLTDLIGAVHLFPSPGAAAAPRPVGCGASEGNSEMKTGISEASKRVSIGFHFAVTNCSHQTPGGGSGAAGAGATKDRPLLLRREQESIDYDMPDSSDTDSMTFPRTHYEAVAYPPLPTTRLWPTLLCRRQATAGRRSPWRQISVDQPTSRLLLQVVEDPEKDSFPATIANLLKTMAPELRTANNELPPTCLMTCSYHLTS